MVTPVEVNWSLNYSAKMFSGDVIWLDHAQMVESWKSVSFFAMAWDLKEGTQEMKR